MGILWFLPSFNCYNLPVVHNFLKTYIKTLLPKPLSPGRRYKTSPSPCGTTETGLSSAKDQDRNLFDGHQMPLMKVQLFFLTRMLIFLKAKFIVLSKKFWMILLNDFKLWRLIFLYDSVAEISIIWRMVHGGCSFSWAGYETWLSFRLEHLNSPLQGPSMCLELLQAYQLESAWQPFTSRKQLVQRTDNITLLYILCLLTSHWPKQFTGTTKFWVSQEAPDGTWVPRATVNQCSILCLFVMNCYHLLPNYSKLTQSQKI